MDAPPSVNEGQYSDSFFLFSQQTSSGFLFSNLPQGATPSLIAKSEIQYQRQHRLII
jgi:hypothetical protein